jgi:hypothetical protein
MTAAGDAYPFAGGVRFFTRERGNVGQLVRDELARQADRGLRDVPGALPTTVRRLAACCASTAARPPTPTTTTGALRRLGACLTDDAARSAVERAVRTEEGGDRGCTGGGGGLRGVGSVFGLTPLGSSRLAISTRRLSSNLRLAARSKSKPVLSITSATLCPMKQASVSSMDQGGGKRRSWRSTRAVELVRDVLGELNRTLGRLYASEGRPSIPPELRRQKDKKALLSTFFSGLLVRKKSGYYPIEHTDRSISHLHEFGEESQFLTDNRRGCPTFC